MKSKTIVILLKKKHAQKLRMYNKKLCLVFVNICLVYINREYV
ncbi:hypothetical protein BC059799_2420 [Bacillus cereus NVH0597-99]|nr:hypothetical protein BC059799_2420 [Bacillus cereus NVH0597-99]